MRRIPARGSTTLLRRSGWFERSLRRAGFPLLLLLLGPPGPLPGMVAQETGDAPPPDSAAVRENIAAMAAHHLCAGVFVVGRELTRSPARVFADDIARFEVFRWQDDFEWAVDEERREASVWGPDVPRQTAEYNGDQGCTILPPGSTATTGPDVHFRPRPVPRAGADPATTPWPTGDVGARYAPAPPEVDSEALEAALDWAMSHEEHHTRALVVVYRGRILGERYGEGFGPNTPQISWSQGKSIAGALLGTAIQAGYLDLDLDDPAPVPEWHGADDPRASIRVRDLMNMASGLEFENWGLGNDRAWTDGNEHFRIYFEGIDVLEHATNQPMDREAGTVFRYRNSDPLSVAGIVRRAVEAAGEDPLTFPQRALFDRIGARDFVLETDAWGNFIITGYDFGSALDWARFGLLHLRDGVWEGERILPEGWVDFVSSPRPDDPGRNYGGLFWVNDGGMLPDLPADAFHSAGFMGQHTVIIPSRDLVVVRLGPSPGNSLRYVNDVVARVMSAIEPPQEPDGR